MTEINKIFLSTSRKLQGLYLRTYHDSSALHSSAFIIPLPPVPNYVSYSVNEKI
jgi:hypothetical protein